MGSISIHIVTFNSVQHIRSCLEAIGSQTYPIHEIVIIDNHSTDDTVQVIRQLSKEYAFTFIQNEGNKGFAVAHNQALQLTDSSCVLVLNPDVTLHSDYLHYTVNLMEKDKKVGSVTGKLLLASNPKIIDSTGLRIKKNRQALDRGANEMDECQWEQQVDLFGVSGAAALYRREMIEDISINGEFFDELFFAYKEDVDVAWRGCLLGWNAKYEPSAIAFHERGWGTSQERKDIPINIRQHSYINRYYMMIKNDSLLYIFLHLPFILTYEFVSFSYILVKEKKLLDSWRRLLKGFPALLKTRKYIQQKRKVPYQKVYRYFK